MTHEQKEMITAMRQKQLSYSVISKEIGVSVNTIKTFCRRNGLTREKVKPNVPRCKNCGKDIIVMSETRPQRIDFLGEHCFFCFFPKRHSYVRWVVRTPRNGGLTMTDIQKQRIKEMRESGLGYKNSVLECRINYGCQHELPPFLPIG